jgi:RNA polymerase sigma-70 factor (ECF subfamily)
MTIPRHLAERLCREARAERWGVSVDAFAAALDASAERAFSGRSADADAVARYLNGLHLADLALASACASGEPSAWDHFVLEFRPILYRSADALDPSGSARELADSLYADLYGVDERDGARRSLFRYFHGRSSLATWLRAVLSQRFIDRVRAFRRLEPLADEQEPLETREERAPDPDRARYLTLIQRALTVAVGALAARDRLRLSSYYVRQLTLAQVGRLLKEHEATVSRQLARTRITIRQAVEHYLTAAGLSPDEVAECFANVSEDPGSIDLGRIVARKESESGRSI